MTKKEAQILARFYINTTALSDKTKIYLLRNLERYLYPQDD